MGKVCALRAHVVHLTRPRLHVRADIQNFALCVHCMYGILITPELWSMCMFAAGSHRPILGLAGALSTALELVAGHESAAALILTIPGGRQLKTQSFVPETAQLPLND